MVRKFFQTLRVIAESGGMVVGYHFYYWYELLGDIIKTLSQRSVAGLNKENFTKFETKRIRFKILVLAHPLIYSFKMQF